MVHVKKVEIFGFKSFGFKNTTVNFEPGLVSISGPNGSGKSNILDAVIFAMGENKPRVMRVDKLRSLIHDIEGNRRGPRMARSSVHFDNSDRKIPVASDTVEITRELDEQGENTYYLNKKKSNRTHILDLLNMANAGLGQLNAVQQGTVTRISEFTSEEKRKTIEDLIGLSYFDEKKAESIKQLDDADRRLDVALAKMDEVKKRIDELDEERNQKMRHDLLERELNRYKAISAASKIKSVTEKRSATEAALGALDAKITESGDRQKEVKSEMTGLEGEKSKLMDMADDYAKDKAKFDLEIARALEEYENENSAISAAKKRIQYIEKRIPELKSELVEIERMRTDISSQMAQAGESIQEINYKKDKNRKSLDDINSRRDKVLGEQSEAAAKKTEIDGKIQSLTDQFHSAKLILSTIQGEKNDSMEKITTNSEKYSKFETDVTKLHRNKERLESVMKNHGATIAELKSRIMALQSRKNTIHDNLDELGLILEKSSNAATQYQSKIKTVKGFMHEDYSVAKLKEDADKLGIQGLVYELISWDKEFERAVLAVSSDWIKTIVVKDFATLLFIAQAAREKKLPKLKIIPLDAIPKFTVTVPDEPGIAGVLSDYVKCKGAYEALKTFLFGNIVLTRTRESAYNVSQKGYKAVTMDGEYFEARGGAVVIDINSKISKLTKLISMSNDIDGLFKSISLIKKYMQRKKLSLKKLEGSVKSNADRLSLSEQSLASASENHANLQARIGQTVSIKQQLQDRISGLEARNKEIDSEVLVNESRVESLDQRISIMRENYAGGQQAKIAAELSRINEDKANTEKLDTQVMDELKAQSLELARLQVLDQKHESSSKNLRGEEASLDAEMQALHAKIQDLEKDRRPKHDIIEQLREKEQELISSSGSSIERLKGFDDRLKILSGQNGNLTAQINASVRESDRLKHDLAEFKAAQASLQQILTKFGIPRDVEQFEIDVVIHALDAELKSLDALNAKAPETYVDVSEGYRSMSERKNVLEGERNKIVHFLEGIEKEKRQTFLDAFDKVDGEIRLIFNKMTGGESWLELQNEDEIFDSGISYMIKFPNKPKRESTSISGGEKTLAAIVFVLALQKLKPSPFYLFDEVDAHLDAPNSKRLSNILEERSKESQFIMVSLKDSVVQKAKLIYGVFPKNGVSHVVTYKDKRMPSVKAT